MSNVVNLQEFRKRQQSKRMSNAVKNADIEGVIDEFLFDLDVRNNRDEVNCSFTLEEDGTVFDFTFSHEEYPLPVAESTLFGWSVRIWDFHQQQWFTLPDYFESENAAYDQAEKIMKSIDGGNKND
tara:strand:- start:2055 stop:2432 length:378 start_codon:yes stop_codon:yes gene_type:complete